MKKLQKIYYVPGMISLLLIPMVFWHFGRQRIQPKQFGMDLGIPAKHIHSNKCKTTKTCFESFRNWNYKKIEVPPNSAKQNIDFYVTELKKLQAKNQKETGIEFVINDQNSYQDFITLIDAMKLAKQENYGVDMEKTGHFFAVH